MENEHENVAIGKAIDENSYPDEKKHLLIDGTINIDFIRQHKQIHEVKKSKSIEEASIWQIKYYLYYLEKLGMEGVSGVIDYPLLHRNIVVELTDNERSEIEILLTNIENIVSKPVPPTVEKMKICNQCAYFELCFI